MPAFSIPLPGADAHLVVDAAGQPCDICHRVAALLVVRWVGTELITRCFGV